MQFMTERFVQFFSKAGATKYYTECALLYEFKLTKLDGILKKLHTADDESVD